MAIVLSHWHALRSRSTSLLPPNKQNVKLVHERPRHASAKIKTDIYSQTGILDKRRAQSRISEKLPKADGTKSYTSGGCRKTPMLAIVSPCGQWSRSGSDGNRVQAKLLNNLASPTGFEPVLSP